MRFYRYNGVLTLETNLLRYIRPKSRGMALRNVILLKKPQGDGQICTRTGCKSKERVLKHEYKHIQRQKEEGLIWFYNYLTDEEFELEEERIATDAELM